MGPERWWTLFVHTKVRRNSDERFNRFWRANQSFDMNKGAKDLSNYLVAGSYRSFSQDSKNLF